MPAVVQPSLERIIRDARIALRQQKAENSRFTDAELTGYANDAIQQIFAITNETSEGQFDKTTTLNIVSGAETVALPTDCFAVKTLYKVQGTVNRRLEYKQTVLDDYDNNATNSGSTTYEPYYYFRANNIVLRPIPGFSETAGLVIEYTSYPDVLVYGGDILTSGISPVFKELVVSYVISKAKFADDLSGGGQGFDLANSRMLGLFKEFRHQMIERSKAPQYVTCFEPV